MFAAFGQFASTSQFYLYGRSHCTKTGWEKASKAYPKPDILGNGRESNVDLSGKVFMVTGANAGIGKEVASFLARNKATLYMVCRSAERGLAARNELAKESLNDNVHLLLGDCSLEKDVRRVWREFEAHRQAAAPAEPVKLDALVCNAGALLNELTLTEEDVETTFAGHLLFGTYLLGSLAMPTLQATPNSRLIAVSSGGMYNSKFPTWEKATCTGGDKYDGQFAYVYAKRGQVLLCEEWAKQHRGAVKVVSCHPGWVDTPGVESAYGPSKKYLEPLRTLWEGSEGIVWLCVAPPEQIEDGAFYLDRSPQVKHLAGPFFTEGSYTKNTPEEVAEMMQKLQQWASGDRPTYQQSLAASAVHRPLTATSVPIELASFMGDWHVLANIPTSMEVGATNCIEKYQLDDKQPPTVNVEFEYSFAGAGGSTETAKTSQVKMRGLVKNHPTSTLWAINPKVMGFPLPIGLSYLILDCAEDYSYTLVGVPDRSYLWVMIRNTPSEFKQTSVPVTEAYPELRTAPLPNQDESPAALRTAVPGANADAAVNQDSAVPAPTSGEKAEPAGALPVEMDSLVQANKRQYEVEVLRRAVAKAAALGIDVSKIQRCAWHNQLQLQAKK